MQSTKLDRRMAPGYKGLISTVFAILFLLAGSCLLLHGQVNVTTWHNDNGRTGQNLNETILTPSNVNSAQFGKLFSQAVDGYVYAQPLYLSGVTIGGVQHNVVYVATQHDSVYAFDADSNAGANANPLWSVSLLSPDQGAETGATPVSSDDVGDDIWPEIGITGTPVIDAATGTLYVVSKSEENGGFVQRLHALDVTSGAEKLGGPVVITATVTGTGVGSAAGTLTFDPEWENQRPALLLQNGIVYIGYASHGDDGPWHGWLLAYSASTLKQTGAFCATRNGVGGGIWMSGAGIAGDLPDPVHHPYGRIFVPTGNGDYTATPPYTNNMEYGDSILNLDLTNGVPTVKDEFTPSNQVALDAGDLDVASGGAMILPPQSGGSVPNLLVQAGKAGTIYLLNRENLGGYTPAGDQVVQEIPKAFGGTGVWSSPAYWNGNVYYWAMNDTLKQYALVNGKLTGPVGVSSERLSFPGATPTISANGNSQGIVWAINSAGYGAQMGAILIAHDAANPQTTLYTTATNVSRDDPGPAVKFTVPTIANGKVYVGAEYQVSVYGLINGIPTTAAPQFTPVGGNFAGVTLNVSITDATPGATIYYTTDGTRPTVASNRYAGPITLSTTTRINAMAVATGSLQSAQSTTLFTASSQAKAPTFSVAAGTYNQPQSVSIASATSGASIYYTVDGSTPVPNAGTSLLYTAPVAINSSTTIQAIATAPGWNNSIVTSDAVTLAALPPTFNKSNGNYSAAQVVTITDATPNTSIYYTTDGSTPVPNSGTTLLYSGPITINETATIDAIATRTGWSKSDPSYVTLILTVTLPTFGKAGGNFNAAQSLTLNDATPGASIYYTTDGSTPVPNAGTTSLYSGPIAIGVTTTVKAIAAMEGWNNSAVASETLTLVATAPTFSKTAGNYNTPQTVTLGDTTPNASIYYTTDGTVPVPNSGTTALYNGPIAINATTTIKAIASVSGWSNSPLSYVTLTLTALAPTFSKAAGNYNTAQTVALSDATPNASIYYTIDGSTPVPNAGTTALYTGPVAINVTTTIKALASVKGWSNSAVAQETMTLTAVVPTFGKAGGSYNTAQSVTLSDTTPNASIYYTTDGTAPVPNAGTTSLYSGALTINKTTVVKAIASVPGWSNSATASTTYTLTPVAPTFSEAGRVYNSAQSISLSDATANTSIYYTLDGTVPVPNTGTTALYTGPITIASTTTIKAIASVPGWTNSAVAYETLTLAVTTPTFGKAGGTYGAAQSVSLNDATPNASIYYTLDGSVPVPNAGTTALYTAPLTIGSTTTVKAIASLPGWANSTVALATYTFVPATPTFSKGTGSYTAAQTVSLSDVTPNASIYYTLDGTVPVPNAGTTSLYSGPIAIGKTTTIKAIASVPGWNNSAAVAVTLTLVATPPTFSKAAGSYSSPLSLTLSDATPNAGIYYTLDGTTPVPNAGTTALYSGALTISSTTTVKAIASVAGWNNSAVVSATYTLP